MEIAVKGILAVFWLVLVPIAVGRLPFIKRRQPLLLERFLVGYLILFSLMEILALPMIFLKMPLHVLTISYGAAILLLAAGGIFVTVRQKDRFCLARYFMERKYLSVAGNDTDSGTDSNVCSACTYGCG